jgi:hypothetical protein
MERHLPMPEIASRGRGRAVAAYRNLRGAALASERLAATGTDFGDVSVRPVLLSADRTAFRRLPDEERQRRRSAAVGALVGFGAVVAAAGVRPLTVLVAAAVAGVAAIAAVGLVLLLRRWHALRIRRAGRTVQARAFEVLVSSHPDDAEHELATWWDPAAPPAPARR